MTASVTGKVQELSHGRQVSVLARVGLGAKALIYVLIGYLALRIAFGRASTEADQRGALEVVARQPGGAVLLWLLAAGLVCCALWLARCVLTGVPGEGDGVGARAKAAVSGLVYLALAVNAVAIALHSAQQSEAGKQQTWSATVMAHTGGRFAIGAAGLIVIAVGCVQVYEAMRRKFLDHLDLGTVTPATRRSVEWLGVVGSTARGLVVALTGVLLMIAAIDYDPAKARGLDGALRSLAHTAVGPWLLVLAGVGLITFGVFGAAEARWQRT
jgi:hypothetical protein